MKAFLWFELVSYGLGFFILLIVCAGYTYPRVVKNTLIADMFRMLANLGLALWAIDLLFR